MKKQTRLFREIPKRLAATELLTIVGNFLFIEQRQHVIDALSCLLLVSTWNSAGSARPVLVTCGLPRHEPKIFNPQY
jgi:hypothetical protein